MMTNVTQQWSLLQTYKETDTEITELIMFTLGVFSDSNCTTAAPNHGTITENYH